MYAAINLHKLIISNSWHRSTHNRCQWCSSLFLICWVGWHSRQHNGHDLPLAGHKKQNQGKAEITFNLTLPRPVIFPLFSQDKQSKHHLQFRCFIICAVGPKNCWNHLVWPRLPALVEEVGVPVDGATSCFLILIASFIQGYNVLGYKFQNVFPVWINGTYLSPKVICDGWPFHLVFGVDWMNVLFPSLFSTTEGWSWFPNISFLARLA